MCIYAADGQEGPGGGRGGGQDAGCGFFYDSMAVL